MPGMALPAAVAAAYRKGPRVPLVLVVVGIALVANAAGLILLSSALAERGATSRVAELNAFARTGPLFLNVERATWLGRDRRSLVTAGLPESPGLLLHSAPPKGMRRVRIEASLRNQGEDARSLGLEEFGVRADNGSGWPAKRGSFRPANLAPGQVLYIDLFFDVPDSESTLFLVWSRDAQEAWIRIPATGTKANGHN